MFEAVFNIVALVECNGQGQRLFKVFEQGAPVKEHKRCLQTIHLRDWFSSYRSTKQRHYIMISASKLMA